MCYTLCYFIINKYTYILESSFYLIPFVGVIISILFGGSICGEVESGTFKYYLTKPFKRYKIYLSKLFSALIYSFVCIIVIILCSLIVYGSVDFEYIYSYLINSIPLIFLCNYILFLSISFKSQVFVSCLSILTLLFSLMISQVLFGINIKFIEYSFLPYMDFSIFKDKWNA